MKKCLNTLEKSIEHILYFENENAIDLITKTVFESILKAERTEFLANDNSENNKANGYYSRLAKAINKYFKLSIPRDRMGLFKPVFLDCIKEQDQKLMDLSFKLYTKGLSTREVSEILEEFYDKKISASWVSNITKSFEEEREAWQNKKLEKNYYFVYIDALNISVRRDTVSKEAFYVVMGVKEDLTREILGVYNIPTETIEGWREVFKDLKRREFEKTLMIIADGLGELENIVEEEFSGVKFQKCITHKKRNIELKVRAKDKALISEDLKKVFQVGKSHYTKKVAKKTLKLFVEKWEPIYKNIGNHFPEKQIDYFFNYLEFPTEIQSMIYTTNWIERLNKTIRRTTKIRNSFPNIESALNLICSMIMDKEESNYGKYPVTAFKNTKDTLDAML